MKYSVIGAHEIGASERATWLRLQRENAELTSPYFCPEFTQAVASARRDVRVCVLEEDGRVVAYFPFQRSLLGAGRPVGGSLSDFHGVIARPETAISVVELLGASRLAYWEFDHLLATQAPFSKHHKALASSPALDLSQGFSSYVNSRRQAGSNRITQLERKARKLEREVGPVRFVTHTADARVLAQVFAWKSDQCRRTGVFDFFQLTWTRELVDRILSEDTPHFAGRLSALYAGDQLLAAHMGMRSDRVWHWWFPVYDHASGKYSPGGILLLRVAEAAAADGALALDLGKGDDPYKQSFADFDVPLAEGCATRRSVRAGLRRLRERTDHFARTSPFTRPIRPALRTVRRWVSRASGYSTRIS